MKITLLTLFLLFFNNTKAQITNTTLVEKSPLIKLYKITADSAEKYIRRNEIPIEQFENVIPFATFLNSSLIEDSLSNGHFIAISLDGIYIKANIISKSNFTPVIVNNKQNLQIQLREQNGDFIGLATIFVNNKQAAFNVNSKSYWIKQKQPNDAFVKIITTSDTIFFELSSNDDSRTSIAKQCCNNFKQSKFGNIINWLPNQIKKLLIKKRYKKNIHTKKANGYMLFNHPKYKLTDTVKLKSFLLDKKNKPLKEPLNVWLNYYAKGKYQNQLLQSNLFPVSSGSYVYEFALSDTLANDVMYSIQLKTQKNEDVYAGNFRTEDYILNDIAKYDFSSNKTILYPNDSIVFKAKATDANGLLMLDIATKLTLLKQTINKFYSDSMYVDDTLAVFEKPLSTNNETVFAFNTNKLPNADLQIMATLQFRNSNNETQTKQVSFEYKIGAKELIITQENDSILADYRLNGKSFEIIGEYDIESDLELDYSKKISYPRKIKIDPLVDSYLFKVKEKDSVIIKQNFHPTHKPNISLWQINNGDTLGFHLMNSFQIPVEYQVYNGNKIIDAAQSNLQDIVWQKKMNNKKRAYKIQWQYYWNGEQFNGNETIGLLYNNLKIDIKAKETIYPGEKDSVTITTTDFHNKPIVNVNLAAVSYNSKFGNDIKMPKLPFIATYKLKKNLQYNTYDLDKNTISKKYSIAKNIKWLEHLKADTSLFYSLMFPKDSVTDIAIPTTNILPQVAVNIVENGVQKNIYILYINRSPVYYSNATNNKPFAFETDLGYTQLGIRIQDKYIEIDSIYLQAHYKHNLVFDINKLPKHSFVKPMSKWLSGDERYMLEKILLKFNNKQNYYAGYLWQNENLEYIEANNEQTFGPFMPNDSVQFFAPNHFDIKFNFKPGFSYRTYPKLIEATASKIFNDTNSVYLNEPSTVKFKLNDTLRPHPIIEYIQQKQPPIIDYRSYSWSKKVKGNLQLNFDADAYNNVRYILLIDKDSVQKNQWLYIHSSLKTNIDTGKYYLTIIKDNWRYQQIEVHIKTHKTYCLNIKNNFTVLTDSLFETFKYNYVKVPDTNKVEPKIIKPIEEKYFPQYSDYINLKKGKCLLRVKVVDELGKLGIAGATVMLAGTRKTTITNANGYAQLDGLTVGKNVIRVLAIGYTSTTINTDLLEFAENKITVKLKVSSESMSEVVVTTGYSVTKKKSFTSSISISSNDISDRATLSFDSQLTGKVAGLQVSGLSGLVGENVIIRLRGTSSISSGSHPLIILDGIPVVETPAESALKNIDPEDIASIDVLKDAAATDVYGARGANGVLIITTKRKTKRTDFKDYAIWQPELNTNKNGQASFSITYPDNINGWNTYVLAMDRKHRTGKGFKFIKSYKPLSAELALPSFLIQGDSVELVGKALNHSAEGYNAKTIFSATNNQQKITDTLLKNSSSFIDKYNIKANNKDSLFVNFSLSTTTGFRDEEQRKIAVLQQGVKETDGKFEILINDTTIKFERKDTATSFTINLQADALQVMLDETENIKKYPYYCMEQTASKLKGMLLQKQIKNYLNQPFDDEKEIEFLKQKLIKSQLFSGGWAWWSDGNINYTITNYILDVLAIIKDDSLANYTVRNGLLFLQNNLSKLNKHDLLNTLQTMSSLGSMIDYSTYLQKINFDSVSTHQQWQLIAIYQNLKLPYQAMLQKLLNKATSDMIYGIYWGDETYNWSNTRNITTNLAFSVLQKDGHHQSTLQQIARYLLHQRKNGFWRNTVESATIANTLLPYLMQKQTNQPTAVSISGDTSFLVQSFPFITKINSPQINKITISKSGAGIVYFTAFQKYWNPNPIASNKDFSVKSVFQQNNSNTTTLQKGQKAKLITTVENRADAEYVMVEIPIPAGCVYANKNQSYWGWQKEFYKNKMMIFIENLPKGSHNIEIDLECRYGGVFTINPAKAELMYFPTFFGRDEMKKVAIQ